MLGISPVVGRTFRPEEDQVGGAPVALLGDGFWRRDFGSSSSALGQSLTMNGTAYTVVGVVPGCSLMFNPRISSSLLASGMTLPFATGASAWA
jgi:hypothetical protein